MVLLLKIALPVVIFVGAVFAAKTIRENAPEPRQRPQFEQVLAVEATTYQPESYQVTLQSRGNARPQSENGIVPEITGTVTAVSPKFVQGGSFKQGDVLVELDQRDFEIALVQAQANVAQASAVLQEEQARSKQAKADWKSLGRKGKPSALTARVPQVAAARAQLASAKAQVQKAELDLERTRIVAAFDGRVMNKSVDVGEFVNRGTMLGRIYAISALEVRLPLAAAQLAHLDIPEGEGSVPDGTDSDPKENVSFKATIGNNEHIWKGYIVRSEGIDTTTQQLNVVARIDQVESDRGEMLRVGQYLTASITANRLDDVFVVPRGAVREDREVVLVNKEGELSLQPVSVEWTDETVAALRATSPDLPDSPVIVTTVLGTVVDGTRVRATIDGKAPARRGGNRPANASGGARAENAGGAKGGRPENAGGGKKGERGQGRPEGQNAQAGAGQGGNDPRAKFREWRGIIESGGSLPEEDMQRIRERIASGGRVPPWLREHVESQ